MYPYTLCRYGKVKNQVGRHTFPVMCTNVLHSPAQVSEIHMWDICVLLVYHVTLSIISWNVYTCVVVPGRNQTLFHCILWSCYCIRCSVVQNRACCINMSGIHALMQHVPYSGLFSWVEIFVKSWKKPSELNFVVLNFVARDIILLLAYIT